MSLVVLSAGTGRQGVRAEINRELQRDLATLSGRVCHVIGRACGHAIAAENPMLLVSAIRAAVTASKVPLRACLAMDDSPAASLGPLTHGQSGDGGDARTNSSAAVCEWG